MRKLTHITGLIFFTLSIAAWCPAAESLQATLDVSDQPSVLPPFLPVTLTLQAKAAGPHLVYLRDIEGGPLYQYPVSLTEDRPTALTVYLPPLSTNQTYRIWLDANAPPAQAAIQAELVWPAEKVSRTPFFNAAAYEPFRYDLPAWPPSLTWRAVCFGGILCFALWGVLLIRRPGRRAFCFLLILLAAGGYLFLSPRPETLLHETHNDLLVLRSRRTCEFESSDWRLIPLYATGYQFEQDNTVIRIAPPTCIKTTVYPNHAKIFKIMRPSSIPETQPQAESHSEE